MVSPLYLFRVIPLNNSNPINQVLVDLFYRIDQFSTYLELNDLFCWDAHASCFFVIFQSPPNALIKPTVARN